jgi:diguanylate cyclase (GGDEF)-like protein
MTFIPNRFLPRTLSGRLFATFGLCGIVFLLFGLGMFYRYQFTHRLADVTREANTIADITVQTVARQLETGDQRQLRQIIHLSVAGSALKSVAFSTGVGNTISVRETASADSTAPAWLARQINQRLPDVWRPVAVNGRVAGMVRLEIDERAIAAELWSVAVQTAGLVAAFALACYFLMRSMLGRWLAHLGRLQNYDNTAAAGETAADGLLLADAPHEIRDAIAAVNRVAASMRDQYGQRISLLMHSLVQHKNAIDTVASVCEVDTAGRIVNANDQFVRHCGFPRQALIGMELAQVGRAASTGDAPWSPSPALWKGEVVQAGARRETRWDRTVVPVVGVDRAIEKYICIDIDITARARSEQAIRDNARRQTLMAALGQDALHADSLDALFVAASNTAAKGLDSRFAAVLEADSERNVATVRSVAGWPIQLAGSVFDCREADRLRARPGMLRWSAPLRAARDVSSGVEAPILRGSHLFGTIGVYENSGRTYSPVEADFLHSIAALLATAVDRHEARNRLAFLDEYDPLTDLPNRRRLARHLDESIGRARERAGSCAVLAIDLDRFKDVNDMLGRAAGDELLVQAARRLLDCARAGDLVGRLGGDVFAVVLPAAGQDEGDAMARAVVQALGRPFSVHGQQVYATASVGIASWPADGTDADALLASAGTAMSSAKNSGRSRHAVYSAGMNEHAARRLRNEAELRQAIEREQFELYYQPKVDLASGNLAGFEALLRWNHPERGLVAPLEFISILEETALIIPLGEWIIAQVCRQHKLWQAAGLNPVPVAVNLSARQFHQDDLAAVIARIVGAAGIEPRLVEFELTESMLMTDPQAAAATLAAIKELGMCLSVDDFGTGYSSLAYLKRFPLDTLKIDRAFVRDLPGDADDAAITQAVVSLAHHLSLKVVAEGVENLEQMRALFAYGCDQVQGYYTGRPLPGAQCNELLAHGHVIEPALFAAPAAPPAAPGPQTAG